MNETAEAPNIAVIRARMPYIDRRSLSEAWFSALHLASDGAVLPRPADRRGLAVDVSSEHSPLPCRDAERPSAARIAARKAVASRAVRGCEDTAQRTPVAAPKVKTRGATAGARSYAPFRTSLTVGIEGERVALLLRREGATLHVVALCRPAVAELVGRALACADLFLRARGESIVSRVETSVSGDGA